MIEYLKHIDHLWFGIINGYHDNNWDSTIHFLSDYSWYMVMAIILGSALYVYKKHFWIVVLAMGLAWGLADLSSTRIFKNNVKRLRPCHSELHKDAYAPLGCGGQYGFVSSHASNSAALAVMSILLFAHWARFIGIFWVIVVCYTRIYLGKHYPLDLIGGALLGTLCSWLLYTFLIKKLKTKFVDDH